MAEYDEEGNVLIILVEVRNETNYLRVDGVLNLRIVDKFGVPIYNGTIKIKKTDFRVYEINNTTAYRAQYIIESSKFEKGLSNVGRVYAVLEVGNQSLERTFLSYKLPEMNREKKRVYLEKIYLRNAYQSNTTQIIENLTVKVIRYGIYINPDDLRKYLRFDVVLRNNRKNEVKIIGERAVLFVNSYPVEGYSIGCEYPLRLKPNSSITKSIFFPLEFVDTSTGEIFLKLEEIEESPEKLLNVRLPKLNRAITYIPINITKNAEKFSITITIEKYASFVYETLEGSDKGVQVVLKLKNTGANEIIIDPQSIELIVNGTSFAPIQTEDIFIRLMPNSEKETWLLYPYAEGKGVLKLHLIDWNREEFLEFPLGTIEKPNVTKVVMNKTMVVYPFVIKLLEIEKLPYLEIDKMETMVRIKVEIKNIGEIEHIAGFERWALATQERIAYINPVLSQIGEVIILPGASTIGMVAFTGVPDVEEYKLKIPIPRCQKTVVFKLNLTVHSKS
ncbi:Hypothetical protein TES1_1933 [Thermococcus paralvinellae]|uniref:Uncharacterized protein n=2 Tax=Thermococcus paralvinellae TaxID=582419 RepID=W0IA47_9EURY|nr:Hypothetical protein TES1_1933 [Thermococcus paralvinellae]